MPFYHIHTTLLDITFYVKKKKEENRDTKCIVVRVVFADKAYHFQSWNWVLQVVYLTYKTIILLDWSNNNFATLVHQTKQ